MTLRHCSMARGGRHAPEHPGRVQCAVSTDGAGATCGRVPGPNRPRRLIASIRPGLAPPRPGLAGRRVPARWTRGRRVPFSRRGESRPCATAGVVRVLGVPVLALGAHVAVCVSDVRRHVTRRAARPYCSTRRLRPEQRRHRSGLRGAVGISARVVAWRCPRSRSTPSSSRPRSARTPTAGRRLRPPAWRPGTSRRRAPAGHLACAVHEALAPSGMASRISGRLIGKGRTRELIASC